MPNKFTFPKDFFWGAATSSHQVEGRNHNDWTEWELKNAGRLSKENRGKYPPENYISGHACDHYNRFREDFDIAKSLGHNAHRFSIEWSRIEPEEGKFDEKEIEHYREVVGALRERGIEPFVTLWHWTLPLWVRDYGGIHSKKFPVLFQRFVKRVARELNEVRFWMTLNEPTSIIGNGYLRGKWPPQKKNIFSVIRTYAILADAHRRAYHEIHAVNSNAEVSAVHLLKFIEPHGWNPLNHLTASLARYWANSRFIEMTAREHDFIAVDYYFHDRLQFPYRIINENKKINDMGWELYPEGIYHVITAAGIYKKQLYITENGLADAKDGKRGWFIKEHLKQVARAMQEGADVRGYFHWSLLDNFEWDKGFWPRFGLVEVDYKTMERKIRPSALLYKKIIMKNSIEL